MYWLEWLTEWFKTWLIKKIKKHHNYRIITTIKIKVKKQKAVQIKMDSVHTIDLFRGVTVSHLLLKRLQFRLAPCRPPPTSWTHSDDAAARTGGKRLTDAMQGRQGVTLSTSCWSRSSAGTGRSWGRPAPGKSDSQSSPGCGTSLWLPPECQTPEYQRRSA